MEASKDRNWILAMQDEIKALEENRSLVQLPVGKKTIGNKQVYKIKHKSDETIDKYKTRLVAKGYNLRYGIDYIGTFILVLKMVTMEVV